MTFLLVILLVAIVWIVLNIIKGYKLNDDQAEQQGLLDKTAEIKSLSQDPRWKEFVVNVNKPKLKRTSKQTTHLRKIGLVGVWFNDGDRKEAFAEVQEGDAVIVTFDYGNPADKNALGVYTKSGKLLGYIPRDNKIVIGAFRRQSERTAIIIQKNNGKTQWEKEIRIEFSIA